MPAKSQSKINKAGIYSHIYNKGTDNKIIFNAEEDYRVFIGYLEEYLTPPKDPSTTKRAFEINGHKYVGTPHQPKNYHNEVELIAYSLLPDHFHLVLHQVNRGSLEKFMRSLATRYSIYFNKKYVRGGTLFAGPYKSVRVLADSILPRLVRYIHQESEYSSHKEHIGSRETSWVNPSIALSLFGKGEDQYKDFLDKYEPDEKEIELVSKIIIETATPHLERRDFTMSTNGDREQNTDLKHISRVPEILIVSCVMFFVLFGLGVRNIMVSQSYSGFPLPISSQSQEAAQVLGTENTNSSENQPEPTSEPTPQPTPETIAQLPQEEPREVLKVKIDEAFSSVNIRKEPSSDSVKLGKASGGDTFEFVSKDAGWYGIKLPDGSTGFISKAFIVEIEKQENN